MSPLDFIKAAALGLVGALGSPSEAAKVAPRPNGKGSFLLVRDGYQLKELPGPVANKRVHAFEDVGSLADWLNRHAEPESVEVLVAVDKVSAALTPGDVNGDAVTCPLSAHPRFARWAAIFGQDVGQRDLLRFVLSCPEDFLPVTDADGTVLGGYGETLAAQLGKFNMQKLKDVSIEVDERGVTTFCAVSEKTTVQGRLPRSFIVRVPMFLGVQRPERTASVAWVEATYDLEVTLGVDVEEGGAPTFTLSCPALEVIRRQARLDAVAWLRKLLKPEFLVGLGQLALSTFEVVAPTTPGAA